MSHGWRGEPVTSIDRETLVCAGDSSCVIMRGHVVRAGKSMKWALGMEASKLSAELKARGIAATQRACPAIVTLENG